MRSAFERYGIEQALVATGAGLSEALTAEGWRIDFADDPVDGLLAQLINR